MAAVPPVLPEVLVAQVLLAGGFGFTLNEDLFYGPERPYDDEVLASDVSHVPRVVAFITPTGGRRPIPYFNNQEDFRTFSLQVLLRGELDDYEATRTKCQAMLSACHRAATSDGYVSMQAVNPDAIYLGRNPTDRPRFVFSVELWYKG